jgi:hypothetical protein
MKKELIFINDHEQFDEQNAFFWEEWGVVNLNNQ